MSTNKHVLLICPGFPASEDDSLAVPYLQDMLHAFKDHHTDVVFSIIAMDYPYTTDNYTFISSTIYPLNGQNGSFLKKPMLVKKGLSVTKKINGMHAIDLVHSFWLGPTTWLGNAISKQLSIPHLAHAMGQDVLKSNRYLPFIQWKVIDRLAYLSLFHQKQSTISKETEYFLPFGVCSKRVLAVNTDKDIDILGVGSFIALKQFHLWLETVAQISKHQPNIKAVLIGDGPLKQDLQALLVELGLSENVQLVGSKDRDEVFSYMKRSKVLLHPSKYESMGMVFFEALAHHMSIVSFEVGSATKQAAWFIAKTSEGLITQCQQALDQAKNRIEFPDKYSASATTQAIYDVYIDMLSP